MNRKKILISVFVAMLAAGSAQAQRVKGSDTLLPLTQELAEDYLEEHPEGEVIVTGGGSMRRGGFLQELEAEAAEPACRRSAKARPTSRWLRGASSSGRK